MKGRARALISAALAAAAVAALTLYAYRELPARPFAADDYQWLLGVRGLSFGEVLRRAFDPGAQSHFYRPLVWLLFWAQTRAFGLDPRGFHAVSLGLHLVNAGLLGWLAWRLAPKLKIENVELKRSPPWTEFSQFSIFNFQFLTPVLAMAIVALHPAPFEAVVWVSAQSELLAAALLLISLHLWLSSARAREDVDLSPAHPLTRSPAQLVTWLLATLALGLALLAKESAAIGLPLLMLLGYRSQVAGRRSQIAPDRHYALRATHYALRFTPYILPALLTVAYVALQVAIERRNYLLDQGGYGFGPQLILNPLRSLALIVAPLPGTEHADAAWLVPVGAAMALVLLVFWILDLGFWIERRFSQSKISNPKSKMVMALALTLLPTAPFASPPDSRYLYLPVMAAALLAGFLILDFGFWIKQSKIQNRVPLGESKMGWFVLVAIGIAVSLAWWASGELHAREWRFAAASGPGGSLWQVASAVCAESRPDRIVIVEPPLAPPHAEAIVALACGEDTRARIVGRDQIEGAIKGRSVVIAFPNGSAAVERRT